MKEPKIVINDYIDITLNNRIIMIKPNGNMEVIADASGYDADEFRHMLFFKNYFKDHYLNDVNLQVYGNNLDSYGAVVFILCKMYGNILLIDTSMGDKKNTYGVVQLPKSITKEQKETFNSLSNYIDLYSELQIHVSPILRDNIPANETYDLLKKGDFNKILDYTDVLENTNKR